MTFKNQLAHLISQINNGIKLKEFYVTCKKFPYAETFLNCLREFGYIHGYQIEGSKVFVYLKYINGSCVLPGLKFVSTSSSKRYYKKKDLIPFGIYSTNKGISFGINSSHGGELLAYIKSC